MSVFKEPVSSVSWAPDGQSFVTSSLEEFLVQWDREGNEIQRTPSPRMYDLKISLDGSKMAGVCTDKRLHVYDFDDWTEHRIFPIGDRLTGIDICRNSRHAILNTAALEVVMVDLETGRVVQKYHGQLQLKWVIRGCFGGADENFVISGSEGMSWYC